jgi:hypothetical protein
VIGLLVASNVWAQNGRGPDPRRVTLQRMSASVSLELEDARLEDVFLSLVQLSNADIEPLWLDDDHTEGLDREDTISLRVVNRPLLEVLEQVLDRAESEFEENSWQLTPAGVIEAGPKSRLNRRLVLKVYDIQDLLFEVRNYAAVPELDLDAAISQSSSGGGGGGGSSIFQDDEEDDKGEDLTDEQLAQRILDLIEEFVEPEQWTEEGISARFYRGTFFIRAPDYIHRQLGGYTFDGG